MSKPNNMAERTVAFRASLRQCDEELPIFYDTNQPPDRLAKVIRRGLENTPKPEVRTGAPMFPFVQRPATLSVSPPPQRFRELHG
jgi:hypothetical protein